MNRYMVVAVAIFSTITQAQAQLSTDRLRNLDSRAVLNTPVEIDTSRLVRAMIPAELRGKGCSFFNLTQLRGTNWHVPVEWRAGQFDISGRGKVEIFSQYIATTGEWWNDNISSLRCNPNCSVVAYDGPEKRGRKISFSSRDGTVDLARHQGWDKAISSMVVSCARLVR